METTTARHVTTTGAFTQLVVHKLLNSVYSTLFAPQPKITNVFLRNSIVWFSLPQCNYKLYKDFVNRSECYLGLCLSCDDVCPSQ